MCGIVGIYAYHPSAPVPDRGELLRIRDHMMLRGPDGAGEWTSEAGRVAFGHRRLSIIDLSDRAAQPMQSADGNLVVTFNGEIYNYRAIRSDLERQGYVFRTQSDTEVLLHLYAAHGREMVRHLRGMFAFAIWDRAKGGLLLVRDPHGVKPLYYSDDGKTFRFASQVKALLAGGKVSRDPDPAGWVGFYYFGTIPEPFTTYRNIHALPAGSTLWIDRNVGRPTAYARLSDILSVMQPETRARSQADLVEIIRTGLLDSVRHHMVSDVPVGIFLSAGIDSGALLGLMCDIGVPEIRSVTLAYEEYRWSCKDEAPLAAKCAESYGCNHTIRTVTEVEFREDLPRILDAMDQPTIDGINTWFVSKAARELGLKAAISGLGGDELFGGYPSYRDIPRLVRMLGKVPGVDALGDSFRRATRPLVARFHPKLAGIVKYGGTFGGAYYLLRGLFMPWELNAVIHDNDFLQEGVQRLDPLDHIGRAMQPEPNGDFARVACLEMSLYMRNQLLRDTDWASMAHSLEVRVPYVDVDLLKDIAPAVLALARTTGKRVLANVSSRALPSEIVSRLKTGFGTPVEIWLQNDPRLRDWRHIRKLAAPHCAWARRWAYQLATLWRSGISSSRSVFSGPTPLQQSVIIFRIGSIGDTVCAMPCFHLIADKFADFRRIVLTDITAAKKGAPVETIIGNSGLVHDVVYFPATNRTVADWLEIRRQIKGTRAKTLIYMADRQLFGTLRDMLFFYMCGIRTIVGAPLRRTDRIAQIDPTTGLLEHETQRLLRCLSSLGEIDLNDRAVWNLHLTADEVSQGTKALGLMKGRPFIAINLGGKVTIKDWGQANWESLLRTVGPQFSRFGLVLLGSSDEWDRCEEIAAHWPGLVLNLCGSLTPRQAAAVLGRATLFIGHDSGPMHLAAAVGVPCVCMFGGYNRPKRWHPHGTHHRIIHNMKGVKEIFPVDVLQAVKEVLCGSDPKFFEAVAAENSVTLSAS
jgi:asparagine synthase (glutamine-hydrolysing)